ncbi:hypothetical protein [Ilumatobacter nonamiensis]|uniref:hypothetical protein n=1 Tax=Ilumatobacter nonamiensis TaxID=467093 RepID=UPI00058F635D|nr:hypothetical protein [Ilumatobacter nonamiensis]
MPTRSERRAHRIRSGAWLVALAVPMLLAAGCTRVSDPGEDVPDTAEVATDAAGESGSAETDPSVSAPESDPPDTSAPSDTSASSTNPGGDTTPATTPDITDGGSTPASSAPDSTEPDQSGGESSGDGSSAVDPDDDDGSNDSAVVTLGAILGAGLLLGVAVLWMLRMNRSGNEPLADGDLSESTRPDAPQ